jgi:hypothetical protein
MCKYFLISTLCDMPASWPLTVVVVAHMANGSKSSTSTPGPVFLLHRRTRTQLSRWLGRRWHQQAKGTHALPSTAPWHLMQQMRPPGFQKSPLGTVLARTLSSESSSFIVRLPTSFFCFQQEASRTTSPTAHQPHYRRAITSISFETEDPTRDQRFADCTCRTISPGHGVLAYTGSGTRNTSCTF